MNASPIDAIRTVVDRLNIRDQNLIVAVSGGADSVALLHLLNDIKDEYNLRLHVGHFDHRLRDDSGADAEWVQRLCEKLKITCVVGSPVEEEENKGQGIEESARRQRYHFLEALAEKLQTGAIAVAHTANDQVETVLHHIARGTGLKGLQGIPEQRMLASDIYLLRPLLKVDRKELIEFLAERDQEYRTDKTNSDSAFTRNRIRHNVLPYLRSHLNEQIDSALTRLAVQAHEAQAAIDQLAERLLDQALDGSQRGQHLVRLSIAAFKKQPRAVVIAAFMELWKREQWSRQKMSQHHWSQLADLVSEVDSGTGLSCPGRIQVTLRRKVLEIRQNQKLT